MNLHVLVVEDEAVLRANVARFLEREGHAAEGVDSAEAALERLAARPYDLVLTDLRMPGMSGLDLLRRVREGHPETLVVVMTAFASVEAAVEALRLGAQDFLLKPISLGELGHRVRRLAEHRELELRVQRLREQLGAAEPPPAGLVAVAPAMVELVRLIDRVAGTRSTALIQGESGTGKELVARALHDRAPWRDRPFVPVHLAAVPRELVDATLFGHERGAFTGATGRREGVFRAAEGGTVFLDEVGELPPEVQVKLLRVLEAREVQPLGSDRPVPVDVRLVAATNRPLKARVEAGAFRADLYYRLDVIRLDVPPLRERPEDVVPVAEHLLARHARRLGRPAPRLAAETAAALRAYAWPGNVRELSNVLERALLLSDGERLVPADLPADLRDVGGEVLLLREAVAAFEARHVRRVLDLTGGDKAEAAERMGIHLATLYRHLEREG